MKKEYFVVLSILVIIYILISIRKNKLSIKSSFGWMVFCIMMLILSICPTSIDFIATFLGIDYPPALFLTLCVVLLLLIDFSYSKKIEVLQKKVIDLAQELSVVKEKCNDKKK